MARRAVGGADNADRAARRFGPAQEESHATGTQAVNCGWIRGCIESWCLQGLEVSNRGGVRSKLRIWASLSWRWRLANEFKRADTHEYRKVTEPLSIATNRWLEMATGDQRPLSSRVKVCYTALVDGQRQAAPCGERFRSVRSGGGLQATVQAERGRR